jgi:hypothetical protein
MGMKGRRSSAGVASTLLAAILVLSSLPASARPLHRVDETSVEPCSASRRDTVLAWDDGNYGSIYDGVTGQAGMALAVMFQAPPWANYITEIQFFIMVDGTADPTEALWAEVWKPSPDMLPEYPIVGWQFVAGGYPKDAWLEVTLTQPVDIADPAEFPDRIFFVGLQWGHMFNPIIGIDLDPPIDCHSYRGWPPGWELLVEGDAMVRAVVAESTTPVEPASWTMIKSLWR